MTLLLRRPSALTQLSTIRSSSYLCTACPSAHSQVLLTSIRLNRRAFATKPPASPKDGSSKAKTRPATGTGKPARGFEGLYGNTGPMSKGQLGSNDTDKTSTMKRNILSKEDEQGLDDLLSIIRRGLPPSEAKKMATVFDSFRQHGIDPEVKTIVDKLNRGESVDVATAARIVRITGKLLLRATEQENKADQTTNAEGEPSGSGQKGKSGGPTGKIFSYNIDFGTLLAAGFATYFLSRLISPGEDSKEITWQEFKTTFLDKGLVDKLTVINSKQVRVDLHREATGQMYPESPAQHNNFRYYFSIGSVEAFERKLDDAQYELGIPSAERIPVSYKGETIWANTILSFGPTILLLGALLWLSRRSGSGGAGGGIFGIGKSKAKKFNQDTDVKVRFGDVAGMDEAKQEIMEFVSFLKEPGQYQRLGAKIPRGALLSGPPGTGKTMLAKATAGEAGVPFFSISGSEFVEIFVGVGASRVRDLFATARKSTPCIIFIDEIDAVGKSRSKNGGFGGGNDEREGTLNQILTEMDGFNTAEQVVVLAGTNRPDVLDQALLRPGRFDRHIAIDRPTMEGRKQIFNVHLKNIVTAENNEHLTGRLAALTPGFSGADIANCVNEAALIAARTSAETVSMTHFEQAIERTIGGLEKKSLVLNPEERKTVAYHEAGHAICGWYFKYADPLLKVSIIPRGKGALGYAQYLPAGDTYLMNVNQLMDRMAMALGGRVSEELHFETVTSGASDDFNKVTRMATAMVTKWGMSKMGYVYFEDDQQQQFQKPFSEHTAQNIDSEVRRIVDEALTQCRDLLTAKKKEVGLVAEELLSKEVLGRDDLVRILGKRPFEDNKEFSKYFDGGKSAPPPPPNEGGSIIPPPLGEAVASKRL